MAETTATPNPTTGTGRESYIKPMTRADSNFIGTLIARSNSTFTASENREPSVFDFQGIQASDYLRLIPTPEPRISLTPDFQPLKVWYGKVLEVYSDTFVAHIEDWQEGQPEEAEIPMMEVDYRDRDLIRTGAPFIWSIGYSLHPSGQKTVSEIRMRRIPNITDDDYASLDAMAEDEFGYLTE